MVLVGRITLEDLVIVHDRHHTIDYRGAQSVIVAVLIVLMHGLLLYLFIAYPVLTRTAKSHFEHKLYHI